MALNAKKNKATPWAFAQGVMTSILKFDIILTTSPGNWRPYPLRQSRHGWERTIESRIMLN